MCDPNDSSSDESLSETQAEAKRSFIKTPRNRKKYTDGEYLRAFQLLMNRTPAVLSSEDTLKALMQVLPGRESMSGLQTFVVKHLRAKTLFLCKVLYGSSLKQLTTRQILFLKEYMKKDQEFNAYYFPKQSKKKSSAKISTFEPIVSSTPKMEEKRLSRKSLGSAIRSIQMKSSDQASTSTGGQTDSLTATIQKCVQSFCHSYFQTKETNQSSVAGVEPYEDSSEDYSFESDLKSNLLKLAGEGEDKLNTSSICDTDEDMNISEGSEVGSDVGKDMDDQPILDEESSVSKKSQQPQEVTEHDTKQEENSSSQVPKNLRARLCTLTFVEIFEADSNKDSSFMVHTDGEDLVITHKNVKNTSSPDWSVEANANWSEDSGININQDVVRSDILNQMTGGKALSEIVVHGGASPKNRLSLTTMRTGEGLVMNAVLYKKKHT